MAEESRQRDIIIAVVDRLGVPTVEVAFRMVAMVNFLIFSSTISLSVVHNVEVVMKKMDARMQVMRQPRRTTYIRESLSNHVILLRNVPCPGWPRNHGRHDGEYI